MSDIFLGKPSENIAVWCKRWYGQNFGWCVKTAENYQRCDVDKNILLDITSTTDIKQEIQLQTIPLGYILEPNAKYIKIINTQPNSEECYVMTADGITYNLTNRPYHVYEMQLLNDFIISKVYYACLLEHTSITLADGSKKMIEDVTYDDELLTYDFDEGKLTSQKPIFIMTPHIVGNIYSVFTFKSNRILRVFGQHRVFSVQKKQFVYMSDCVGDDVVLADGTYDTLVKYDMIKVNEVSKPRFYNVITAHDFNLYANDILTSNRYSNMYAINDMKYVKDDVIKHTREQFNDYITDEEFEQYRYAEQPDTVEHLSQYAVRLRNCKL